MQFLVRMVAYQIYHKLYCPQEFKRKNSFQDATYHHCKHLASYPPFNPATLIYFLVPSSLLGW